jgi:hypothetical protein
MTTYNLKYNDGGVWMDTMSFVELVKELQRLGINAEATPDPPPSRNIQFTLKKSE